MFSRNSKSSAAQRKAQNQSAAKAKSTPPSIISSDLHVVGDLSSDGEIQIDGKLDGDINTRSLLIGETAIVKGHIVADQVRVHGAVEGQIKARMVALAKKAHVIGDILHEDLSIETGAFLEGHCKRMENPTGGKANLTVNDGSGGGSAPAEAKGEAAKVQDKAAPGGKKAVAAPA
jgi:cytoskeletal protein CcmA (bactofilin family)